MKINPKKRKNKSIILYAAGGHSVAVLEILKLLNFDVIAYVDKEKKRWLENIKFLEESNLEKKYKNFSLAIGLGGTSPSQLKKRLKKLIALEKLGKKFPILTHPKSIVAKDAIIDSGVVIMPGAIIRSKAKIEKYSIISSGSIIEHNTVIKKGCHIAPGAIVLGAASCGSCSMIGSNSVVLQNKILADGSFVKAGAVS